MGGREPWPRFSLAARGFQRGRRKPVRRLNAAERAAIEQRLRSEGKLGLVPVSSVSQAVEEGKHG